MKSGMIFQLANLLAETDLTWNEMGPISTARRASRTGRRTISGISQFAL